MTSETQGQTWSEERSARMAGGVKLFGRVAIVIFLAFWAVDHVVYPASQFPGVVGQFLWLRIICAAGYLPVLLLVGRVRSRRTLTAMCAYEVWWVSLVICLMLTRTGYELSLYYAGLMVTMLAAGLIFPWSWGEATVIGVGMTCMYVGVAFANPHPEWRAAANNASFILGALGISIAANVQAGRLGRSEFEGRQELGAAYQRLQELDHAKNDFMANISHEMRTPLTLMLGALESLASSDTEELDQQQLDYVEVIRRNGMSLLRLINDLLDLARLDAAKVRLRLEAFDLGGLVSGIVTQAGPMASWRSLTLDCEVPPEPVEVRFDELKIEKVILNLVANAIKFTPAGGRIHLSVEPDENEIRVRVSDTGIGIAEDQHERIFERFSQVDGTATRQRGGTGIGLALVKQLVELHAGTIGVESVPGKGSTFTVRLPADANAIPAERIDRRVTESDTPLARREEDAGLGSWIRGIAGRPEYRYGELYDVSNRRVADRVEAPPRSARVLVVEDSPDLLRFIALQLSRDYKVLTATDGIEGWERAKEDIPDLVITDLMMPRKDGHWLVDQLRNGAATRRIPIVMLTARGQTEDRVKARQGGADVFLSKPFSVGELKAAVAALLKRKDEQSVSLQRETAASLGVLTAGMAHELLNPLGFIGNSLFILSELIDDLATPPPDAPSTADTVETGRRLIRSARVGVERIQTLVSELRGLANAGASPGVQPTDLNEAIRSTLLLVGAQSTAGLTVHVDLCSDAVVPCRPGAIHQVLLNLVKNALLALPGGQGRLWLSTRRRAAHLEIEVADSGCGIAPEQVERVFDPFFTTRDPGQGTGLGLSLSRQIVESHAGTLTLRSVVGEGTRVIVALPLDGAAAARQSGQEERAA